MGGWYDDICLRDPGLNAGYRAGRVTKQVSVMHFTVGVNSRALIRDKGLAQFLFPKVGKPWQFAESDAKCFHACEWNGLGAGLEFERLSWDEPLTDDQIYYGGLVTVRLHEDDGYPLALHTGSRLPLGSNFRGFANHGSLVHQACDQHTDGITDNDFARMIEGGPELNADDWKKLGDWLQDNRADAKKEIEEEGQRLRVTQRKLLRPIYEHLGIPWPKDE